MSDAARRAAMDKLVPSLEPAEYGQMPASFHANSQRASPTRPIRQPILPRDKYDGVDSDDESDDEDVGDQDDESEEDQPQIVGEVEVDMGDEEDEFLEFSRQALGISDEQWGDIVRDRQGRGGQPPLTALMTSFNSNFS